MNLIVTDTAAAALDFAIGVFARQLTSNPQSTLGLATGRTPILFYARLVDAVVRGHVSLEQVTTFNLDEYVGIDRSDRRSFSHYMSVHLFDKVRIDRNRCHIPNGVAPDLEHECIQYEEKIASAGGIDIQLLGIGRNGHIGFNEPPSDATSRTRIVRLTAETIEDNFGSASEDRGVPTEAITMGIATILEARKVLLIAIGQEKAHAVATAFSKPESKNCPASALQRHDDVTIVADTAAASAIKECSGP